MIGKAERFIVTSLDAAESCAQTLYERLYCARVSIDAIEQHVLPHSVEREFGDLHIEPRRAHLRWSSEAVEYVLCDVGDGKPGAAALARQHRAVDVLRPGLA